MILLDTNILLDFFLRRADFEDASRILSLAARQRMTACIAAHAVTTLGYFMKKNESFPGEFREQLSFLFDICRVLPVDENDLKQAANSPMSDYEDAVMEAVAFRHGSTCIVTRDKKDFRKSRVQALQPGEFLKRLQDDNPDDILFVREPAPDYRARPRRRSTATTVKSARSTETTKGSALIPTTKAAKTTRKAPTVGKPRLR